MMEAPDNTMPPLNGLVLVGGFSRRMGADKADQSYHGRPQGLWAYDALEAVCDAVFLSARASQDYCWLAGRPVIRDSYHNIGPAVGLLSAADADPAAAWLVLACDMPLVKQEMLSALVAGRAVAYQAVAYRHADGTPEPLCAVYEPAACRALRSRIDAGEGASLRAALLASATRWLVSADPSGLLDANDPAHRDALRARLRAE